MGKPGPRAFRAVGASDKLIADACCWQEEEDERRQREYARQRQRRFRERTRELRAAGMKRAANVVAFPTGDTCVEIQQPEEHFTQGTEDREIQENASGNATGRGDGPCGGDAVAALEPIDPSLRQPENTKDFNERVTQERVTPLHPHDDDSRPRVVITSMISEEAHALAGEVAEAAGVGADPKGWPMGWCGVALWVQGHLDSGHKPDLIMIAVKTAMASEARRVGGSPTSPRYFDKPIAQAIQAGVARDPQANYFWRAGRDRKKSAFDVCNELAVKLRAAAGGPDVARGGDDRSWPHALGISAGSGG